MATIIDFLNRNKDVPFSKMPLTDADILCLNEIGYITFGEVLAGDFDLSKELALHDVLLRYEEQGQEIPYDFLLTKDRVDLIKLMISSKRFEGLCLSNYVNEIDEALEKQFAAMVFRLPEINHTQIVFRGTDDSMVGWKEDFKLTYMREIPAHRSAIAYLKNYLSNHEGQVVVSGHSKGGNLAVYATSHLPFEFQEKITCVYMLDAPGLQTSVLKSQSYQAIRSRIKGIRPEESIVGVMLEIDVPQEIVASNSFGVFQHAATNWQVDELTGNYVLAEKPTELSLNLQQTFKQWTDELSSQELKLLFDTLFDTLIGSGITSLNDVSGLNLNSASKFLNAIGNFRSVDDRKKNLMSKSIRLLFDTFTGHFKFKRLETPKISLTDLKSRLDKK
ncbi:Mbeg1-like protein [Streptococcus orisratti]|uniref:Mbeg1-like protein n=1 Tax=Streptococcus orisratti TaxID=114652 RepID=UPI003CFDE500